FSVRINTSTSYIVLAPVLGHIGPLRSVVGRARSAGIETSQVVAWPFTRVLSRPRSVELQKANLEGSASGAGGSGSSPLASAIPLAQLLSKSGALGALSSLSALGGLSDLLAGAAPPVQTTGVHRSHKSFARRADDEPPSKTSKERNKYSPY
ncbi:uncharacterized protein LOC135193357, partial [Vanessa tameamea]|uniref:Uncharacterized protein LOC135193357 n=1 Tax=Vanessa tameamea TaxID=334116 RepID=A0ABM4AJC7_VANTA